MKKSLRLERRSFEGHKNTPSPRNEEEKEEEEEEEQMMRYQSPGQQQSAFLVQHRGENVYWLIKFHLLSTLILNIVAGYISNTMKKE